jgi:hypothetical protein
MIYGSSLAHGSQEKLKSPVYGSQKSLKSLVCPQIH